MESHLVIAPFDLLPRFKRDIWFIDFFFLGNEDPPSASEGPFLGPTDGRGRTIQLDGRERRGRTEKILFDMLMFPWQTSKILHHHLSSLPSGRPVFTHEKKKKFLNPPLPPSSCLHDGRSANFLFPVFEKKKLILLRSGRERRVRWRTSEIAPSPPLMPVGSGGGPFPPKETKERSCLDCALREILFFCRENMRERRVSSEEEIIVQCEGHSREGRLERSRNGKKDRKRFFFLPSPSFPASHRAVNDGRIFFEIWRRRWFFVRENHVCALRFFLKKVRPNLKLSSPERENGTES